MQEADRTFLEKKIFKPPTSSFLQKEKLSMLVPLDSSKIHNQPFDTKFPSNIITATILSFIGKKRAVYRLMQVFSHKSRVFIV